MRIARAAWRGRSDPAGLVKAQLSGDAPTQPAASPPAVVHPAVSSAVAQAPAGPPVTAVAHATVAAAVANVDNDATGAQLLLVL
jgi:hypothetical protein